MTAILTVTGKNQITLPVEMLRQLDINKGDKLLLRVGMGKTLEIDKIRTGLRDVQGSLALTPIGKKFDLDEVIKRAEKKEAKRLINEV